MIWLFREGFRWGSARREELANWILAHTRNPCIPFGTTNHGARSLEAYHQSSRAWYEEKCERARRHARMEAEHREQAGVKALLNAARATRELPGAVMCGDVPRARKLVHAGADLRARTADGETPLGLARRIGRTEMAEMLYALGGNE